MDSYISKTKIQFVVCAMILGIAIVGGSMQASHARVLSTKNVNRIASYIKYKIEFSRGANLLSGAASLFSNKNSFNREKGQNEESVAVLLYHGIIPVSDGFSITPDKFAEQMRALKDAGYETISMDELYGFMYQNKKIPDKSFVLTFDDGRKDSYYGGDPILKALGYQATMFIATGVSLPDKVEKASTYYLSPDEVKTMEESKRWDIESHAVQKEGGFVPIDEKGNGANFLSDKMWLKDQNRFETDEEYSLRVDHELSDSKKTIEEALNKNVMVLSYPFGDYGEQATNIDSTFAEKVVREKTEKNYKLAFHQIWPEDFEFSHNSPHDDPLLLKRIEPSPYWSGDELLTYIETGNTKAVPFVDTFSSNTGWKDIWGALEEKDGMLHVGATTKTQGSFTFLDGTLPWTDYTYTTTIDWHSGSYVVIVGRYQDSENYMSCSINDGYARIEETIGGKVTRLSEDKIGSPVPKKDAEISLNLKANHASCLVGGKEVSSTGGLSHTLSYGGIGFKTWDAKTSTASVDIKKVKVE